MGHQSTQTSKYDSGCSFLPQRKYNSLRRGSFAIFIDKGDYCVCAHIYNTQNNVNKTYAIDNADDDDIDALFGTNTVGAKAVADATKKDITAIENFMLIMIKIRLDCKLFKKSLQPSKILFVAQYQLHLNITAVLNLLIVQYTCNNNNNKQL
jgi:hypothetical protein